MRIDAETIARIDSTLLPQLDRHHLRLLIHCLESFRSMNRKTDGALPDVDQRRRWCEQQPMVARDTRFLNVLLSQLNNAALQLELLADSCGKQPLHLSLDDLIAAAEIRCQN
ncbi:hypothetical protein [Synechococcus sp. M16CYN]|uniref:hypothetical protein n=1 Tax=Synechococcus sp. M16CYN TaxID=3103139 RepID=UPI00324552D4